MRLSIGNARRERDQETKRRKRLIILIIDFIEFNRPKQTPLMDSQLRPPNGNQMESPQLQAPNPALRLKSESINPFDKQLVRSLSRRPNCKKFSVKNPLELNVLIKRWAFRFLTDCMVGRNENKKSFGSRWFLAQVGGANLAQSAYNVGQMICFFSLPKCLILEKLQMLINHPA